MHAPLMPKSIAQLICTAVIGLLFAVGCGDDKGGGGGGGTFSIQPTGEPMRMDSFDESGTLVGYENYTYNQQDLLTRADSYNASDSREGYRTYEYNPANLLTRQNHYDLAGTTPSSYDTYAYDTNDRLIWINLFERDNSMDTYYIYTYNVTGVQQDWYDSDGSRLSYRVYTYNATGLLTRESKYKADDSLSAYTTFTYNEDKLLTQQNIYDPEGTLDSYDVFLPGIACRTTRFFLFPCFYESADTPPSGTLILQNFDANPNTATSGNTITLSVTAHCTGGACPANTIYYYRASNAAFTADITQIGSSSNIRQLNNGQSDNTPAKTDTAPKVASAQTYYYSACIGNGCTPTASHAETVTVNPQPGTLTLQNFDAKPNTATSGDTITLSATAHCTGGGCPANTIHYYRASNAAFTADVTQIGSSSNIRQLNNGQSHNTPAKTDTTPKVASAQTYYYGACIGNGCTPTASHAETVTVNPQPGTLTLRNFDANPNITTSGDTITLSVTAHCTGGPCPANTIHYYRASNAAFTADVTQIGSSSNIRQLNNGQSDNTPAKTDTAPKVASAQTYYYSACIGNGCTPTASHAQTVTVNPQPGTLILQNFDANPNTATSGDTITLSATAHCTGGGCPANTIHYYRASNAAFTADVTQIGSSSNIRQLNNGQSHNTPAKTDTTPKVASAQTYYYGACIGNGCTPTASHAETVTVNPQPGTLTLQNFDANPNTATSGDTITLSATAHCTGGGCPANTIYYYRASNAAFSNDVTQIDNSNVRQLNNGQSDNTLSTTDTTPNVESAQTYYYGACIGNGCTPTASHTQTVTVNPKPPGTLTLQNFDANPNTATSGDTITLSATAHCTGGGCPANTIHYYRASNAAFTADITQIGSSSNIRQLNNGQSDNTLSTTDTTPNVESAQTYYYGACIGNGCTPTATHTQTVTINPKPPGTPTLQNFDANPNTVISGDTITLSVTAHCTGRICNADTIYFYRFTEQTFNIKTPIGNESLGILRNGGISHKEKGTVALNVHSSEIYYYSACIGNGCISDDIIVTPQQGIPVGPASDGDLDDDGNLDQLDIDDDGDGLIEISTAAELYAVRYQLDGTGQRLSSGDRLNTTGCGGLSNLSKCFGYELTNNISLENSPDNIEGWLPLGDCRTKPFSAVFNGNGFAIKQLHISRRSTDCIGLFGYVVNGKIHNLNIKSASVYGKECVGVLVGSGRNAIITFSSVVSGRSGSDGDSAGGLVGCADRVTITSSYAIANSTSGEGSVGGLVGSGSSTNIISSYAVTDSISGDDSYAWVGGLVGNGSSINIISSYAVTDSISGGDDYARVGGLVGSGSSTSIISSYAVTDSISGGDNNARVGGLVGSGSSTRITSSYAVTDSISGNYSSRVGGLVGSGSSTNIISSYAVTDSISGDDNNAHVGGLVGSGSSTNIISSYAVTDSISGVTVGGLIGFGSANITYSYVVANSISGTRDVEGGVFVGGLVGGQSSDSVTITSSYVVANFISGTRDIEGSVFVGGLVGGYSGSSVTITSSYVVASSISGTSNNGRAYTGGLVGIAGAITITSSYIIADSISGTSNNDRAHTGGLVGIAGDITITSSYIIAASISGTSNNDRAYTGGLVGNNGGLVIIRDSYWDSSVNGRFDNDYGIPVSTDDLRSPTNYTNIYATWNHTGCGWDFGSSTDYPAIPCLPIFVEQQRNLYFISRNSLIVLDDCASFPITCNIGTSGQKHENLYPGDADAYRILIFQHGNLTVWTTGDTDTYGSLYCCGSGDFLVISNDNGGAENNFQYSHSVSPGSYVILVQGAGSNPTGAYELQTSFR